MIRIAPRPSRKSDEVDPFYPQLGLPLTARPRDVIKAAAKAMHPWLRRQRSLRLSRRRFYRDLLNSHEAAREATADF